MKICFFLKRASNAVMDDGLQIRECPHKCSIPFARRLKTSENKFLKHGVKPALDGNIENDILEAIYLFYQQSFALTKADVSKFHKLSRYLLTYLTLLEA